LHTAHRREIDPRAVIDRQALKEGDVFALRFDQRQLCDQIDRFASGVGEAVRGADFDAEAAAGAVFDIELQ